MMTPQEGFCRRLLFTLCAAALKNGSEGPSVNGRRLTVNETSALVAYARRYGFLPQSR